MKIDKIIISMGITFFMLSTLIYFEKKDLEDKKQIETPFNKIQHPHSLEVFIMNFFYHHIQKNILIKKKALKSFLNDYVEQPDKSFDMFYIPKRKHYCHANYIQSMLNNENLFFNSKYVFMDYSNKHQLKKKLSTHFDFLNTGAINYKNYNKQLVQKLQNMEWNPKIKLFFSQTNLNYNHEIGKTSHCLFQMINHIPGSGVLHRKDLLVDKLKEFESKPINKYCYKISQFQENSLRLYKKKECEQFFEILQTKKFKKEMKTKILYNLYNINSNKKDTLDFIEIQKLKKIYQNGQKCGKVKNKYIVQEYTRSQLKYKNGRKFVIRVFYIVISTKPLVVLFHKGYVILDRFNNKVKFQNSIISLEKLQKYFKKNKIMNEYSFNLVMNRIKEHTGFLNFLTKKQLLKDPRFYQVIGLDWIIKDDLQPVLDDVKGSVQFSRKDDTIVKQILDIQNEILNLRASKIFDFLYTKKQLAYSLFQNQDFQINTIEEFLKVLEKQFPSKKLRQQFNKINVNELPKNLKQYKDFDLIYDGRKENIQAYKNLIPQQCIHYVKF